jgi:hypothetical protein
MMIIACKARAAYRRVHVKMPPALTSHLMEHLMMGLATCAIMIIATTNFFILDPVSTPTVVMTDE